MGSKIADMVKEMNAGFDREPTKLFTLPEDRLSSMPAVLRNYMKQTGIQDHTTIQTVRLSQSGLFRMKPDGVWTPFKAEQYINVPKNSFIWHAKMRIKKVLSFDVVDSYIKSQGGLTVKLLSLIKVVDESGDEINQGELLRFICECMWYPSLLLDNRLTITREPDRRIRVRGEINGHKLDVVINFGRDGLIREFRTRRYYSNNSGKSKLESWSGYIEKYEKVEGILVPKYFKACWHLDSGDYCYIKANVTKMDFNKPGAF